MSCFKILWILILSISTQIVYGHQKIKDPSYDVNLSILDPENLTTIRLDIIDIEGNENHNHYQRSKAIEIDLGDGTKIQNTRHIIHKYTENKIYNIVIKIRENKNQTTTITKSIDINNKFHYIDAKQSIYGPIALDRIQKFKIIDDTSNKLYKVILTSSVNNHHKYKNDHESEKSKNHDHEYSKELLVSINNIDLIFLNEFKNNTNGKIEKYIQLKNSNTINFDRKFNKHNYFIEIKEVEIKKDIEKPIVKFDLLENTYTKNPHLGIQVTDESETTSSVWVNNVFILSTELKSFNINLNEGLNNIVVLSKDIYGNTTDYIYLNKINLDSIPPFIKSLNPQNNEKIYVNSLPTSKLVQAELSEYISNGSIENSISTIVNLNYLQTNLLISSEGLITTKIHAIDFAGNELSDSISYQVIFDNINPIIKLGNFPNYTNSPQVLIPIEILELNPVTTYIKINGTEIYSTSEKQFNYNFNLINNEINHIEIRSIDAAGNVSDIVKKDIIQDTQSPKITFNNLKNGDVVNGLSFPIELSINEAIVSAQINGQPIKLNEDLVTAIQTQYSVANEGNVDIQIDVIDRAGNSGTATVHIYSVLRPLNKSLIGLYIDDPNKKVIIKGAIGSTRPNYMVKISTGFFSSSEIQADSKGSFQISMNPQSEYKISVYDHLKNEEIGYNFILGAENDSILSGVIRDTDNNPLINAKISILGTELQVFTDNNGVFNFSRTKFPDKKIVGDQTLLVDGSTVIQATQPIIKKFAQTSVAITIGANQSNILQTPIYLPPIFLDGTGTIINTLAGGSVTDIHAPGVELKIPNASVIFPDGKAENVISLQTIPAERSTVPVPSWATPKNVIALEPSGTTFTKSVELTLPNVNEFPAYTDLIILLMNSKTGKWEIGGAATVTDDGKSIVTKPNQGIRHFSLAYATVLDPVVKPISPIDKPGTDIQSGSLSTQINLASFKNLNNSITPQIIYNSSWAKPTAVVTNLFDFNNAKYSVRLPEFITNDSNYKYTLTKENCTWINIAFKQQCEKNSDTFYNNIQYNISYYNARSEIQPEKIESTFRINNIQTDKIQFNNIPHLAAISYGLELKNGQNNYLNTGIYPYQADYKIYFKELIIGTPEVTASNIFSAQVLQPSKEEVISTIPDLTSTQSIIDNVYIQNHRNSPIGVGWKIADTQKIINPDSDKIMIEESNGSISTYNIDNTIQTIIDVNAYSGSIQNGVSLNAWPTLNTTDKSNPNLVIGLTYGNNQITKSQIGSSYLQSGEVKGVDYFNYEFPTNCTTTKECLFRVDLGLGNVCAEYRNVTTCTNESYTNCSSYSRKFNIDSKISHMLTLNNKILGLDLNRHSLFEISSTSSSRILGSTNTISTFKNLYDFQFEKKLNDINSFCYNKPGYKCQDPIISKDLYFGTYKCPEAPLSNNEVPYNSTDEIKNGFQTLNSPMSIIASPYPNIVVIADFGFHKVRWFNLNTKDSGIIAGNGSANDTGDKGPATQAAIYHPTGLVYDSIGNLYISTESGYIRKVDTNGIITTIAGVSSDANIVSQGNALNFNFIKPYGLAIDESKNYLYVADSGSHRILKIDLNNQFVTTVAGNGRSGFSGDDKTAGEASLNNPTHITLDVDKNLIIADTGNNRIRKITFKNSTLGETFFKSTSNDLSQLKKGSTGEWTRTYRNGSIDRFNSNGLHLSSENKIGQKIIYSYNADSSLSNILFQNGDRIKYEYTNGKISSIIDPANRETQFIYNLNNTLSKVIFPDGTSKNFDYDQDGLMVAEYNQLNTQKKYTYNKYNRLVNIQYENTQFQIQDDVSSNLNLLNSGKISTPKQIGLGNNSIKSTFLVPRDLTTTSTRDVSGFVNSITNAKGETSYIQYNSLGKPSAVINSDQTRLFFTYDLKTGDLLSKEHEASQTFEKYTYTSDGQIKTITYSDGSTKYFEYNQSGLLFKTLDPSGIKNIYSYNTQGQIINLKSGSIDSEMQSIDYFYNSAGQLSSVKDNSGKTRNFVYDLAGNQIETSIQINDTNLIETTKNEYDLFNRLTKVISSKNEITSYTYLPTGQLSTIIDPKGNTTLFEYDTKGNLIKKTTPDLKSFQFIYDDSNNLTQEIDPNLNSKYMTYDELNRIQQIKYTDDVIQYSYDKNGNPIKITNSISEISNSFDSLNRITQTQLTGSGSLSQYPSEPINYKYNINNQVTEINSRIGSISYNYDSSKKLTTIQNSNLDQFQYYYDSMNRLINMTRPGSQTSYKYTNSNKLLSISTVNSSNDILSQFEYMYDNRDYPIQKKSNSEVLNFNYDLNGQLTQVTGSQSESFTYDPIGNRITDQNGNYIYNSNSQLLNEDWQYVYAYDNNGNLLTKTPKNFEKNAFKYGYNSKNQLISIQVFDKPLGQAIKEIKYTYDVLNRRLQKEIINKIDITKSSTRKYFYNSENILAELNENNDILAQYTHSNLGPDDVLSVNISEAGVKEGLAPKAGVNYFLKDAIGSITELVDKSGKRVQKYLYSSFGTIVSIQDQNDKIYGFDKAPYKISFTYTGREWDDESGLYFYRARYYDPSIGRFLQQDPDPGKFDNPITVINKYAYVGNNPISLSDPSGMSWISDFWDHNNEWVRDVAVGVATIAILVVAGAPIAGALAAVGSVAGGALIASMAIASRQGGNFWDNTANAFHKNFRIGAAFLALSGIAAATFGGGLAGAGGNGLNGWVLSKNSFFLPKGYEGDLTMGPAALFNGTMRFSSHSFGHTLQFIGIGFITGDTDSTWKYFLGIGLIGTTPIGNFWEHGADFLGGI